MEKKLLFNNSEILYADEGAGLPVIFLHGFCEDHTVWNDFKQPLIKNYRIITPDLAGFGQSALSKSVEDMAEIVKAIADKEQLEKIILIGHSLGGYIALAFAEKYAEQLAGLGLFHSSCFADDDAKKANRLKVVDFVTKNGSAPFVKELFGTLFSNEYAEKNQQVIDGLVKYTSTFNPMAISNTSIAMRNRPERSAVLKKCLVPVLFIIGRFDRAIPFEQSMKMVHFPAISSIHILEHTAHMGMFEEMAKTQGIISEWLNSFFNAIPLK